MAVILNASPRSPRLVFKLPQSTIDRIKRLCAAGYTNQQVAQATGTSEPTVSRIRNHPNPIADHNV